jgi:hypothetical protein
VLLDPFNADALGCLPIYFYSYEPNKYEGW